MKKLISILVILLANNVQASGCSDYNCYLDNTPKYAKDADSLARKRANDHPKGSGIYRNEYDTPTYRFIENDKSDFYYRYSKDRKE